MGSNSRDKKRRHQSKQYRSSSAPFGGRAQEAGGRKSGRSRRRHGGTKPTSSFTPIGTTSIAELAAPKKEKSPSCLGYILGLAGVTALVLSGGGHNPLALSLSLLLPGLALLLHPPKYSPGLWIDRMALAFLGILLFAFIPQFYWPDPDWRTAATEIFGIDLPLSLSIQPWISFEAWVCALAGIAWFYAASSWKINQPGKRWFYFAVSVVAGILALIVLWGNMAGVSYPAAETSRVFSFFPNRNQTANFLALGGVAAFGYAVCAIRGKRLLPLVGFIASGICFLALVWGISRAGVLLYFTGVLLIYFFQLFTGRVAKVFKLGLPLLLVAFSVFLVSNSRTNERILEFMTSSAWSDDYRLLVAQDSLDMIASAPWTGHGLGNFAAVFPQYRELSSNYQRAVHPESDFLWLAAESGIIGLALFVGLIIAYGYRCRGLSTGPGGGYRLVALAALLIFMLHGLADVSGHRPGTVYFAILFAVLAMPGAKDRKPAYKAGAWRLCGGFLVLVGVVWALSGLLRLPLHTSTALAQYEAEIEDAVAAGDYEKGLEEVDKWIDLRPTDWRAYFHRASLTLSDSGSIGDAAADFRRARFAEPSLGMVAFREGLVWLPYDTGRTLAAWREVFFREVESRERVFERMLKEASGNSDLMQGLARLSELDSYYRTKFLVFQSGDFLMEELAHDLKADGRLEQFSREQRTEVVKNWISRGDHASAEKFLQDHASALKHPWWLWSLLHKKQKDYEGAVLRIRSAIPSPVIPYRIREDTPIEQLKRGFKISPGDLMQGTALLEHYIREEDYEEVLEVTQQMGRAQKDVPAYVLYWQAESFFQLNDYVSSWDAYRQYLDQIGEI